MIRFAPGLADRLARLAFALLSIAAVTSCGSGAVSGSAPVNDPSRITILPAIATAFSGLPTTFVISGGTGSYIVSSSNQAIVQVAGSISGNTLTIVPNPVLADTVVTLTVRDTGATPTVSATVTVRPGTVSNDITITPSSTQGGGCAPAICSGGDAEVSATLSQGGIPLPARGVRFEVVSGDFRFITTDTATGVETLSTSVIVITDETGKVRARIRATAGAANQTALLQVTDLGTSAFQRTSFLISQATGSSPGFFTTPTQVTFQGIRVNECASGGVSANIFVFGGTPPYTVSSTSSAFIVSRDFISFSGGSYTVTPNGTCVAEPGAPIIVRDASGRTTTTTVANIPGTQAPPALAVTPSTVSISSCSGSANVTVAGGRQSNYFVSSGSDALVATVSGNTVTITRRNPSPAAGTAPLTVGVSDGTTVANVTVNLTGAGQGACPSLSATPTSVTLTSCAAQNIALSGGSGAYTAASSSLNVRATISGATLSIVRTSPSASFAPPATITVSDANDPSAATAVTVNATGAGTGACP